MTAFEKWVYVNNLFHPDHGFLRCGDQYLDGNLMKRAEAWDAALEEAAKEIKQRFVERNQFGEMVYCADLEQIVRALKEQK